MYRTLWDIIQSFFYYKSNARAWLEASKVTGVTWGRGEDKDILRVYPRPTGNRISRNEVHESGFFISFFGGFFGKLGLKTSSKEYIPSLFFPYCFLKKRPPALLPSSFQFFMLKSLKVSLILPLIPQNQPGNPLGSAFKIQLESFTAHSFHCYFPEQIPIIAQDHHNKTPCLCPSPFVNSQHGSQRDPLKTEETSCHSSAQMSTSLNYKLSSAC